MPVLPETDEIVPDDYFSTVEKAIESKPAWRVVKNDMVLWFFSFSKFLMYRDLDAQSWPESSPLASNGLISSLFESGFATDPPICGDDQRIDATITPADMIHVMDADSSQTLAIEEVTRGRSLVIQGPPGTGKSQTIANIIAACVQKGKKVLFVAEKLTALDVVERRLHSVGIGEACLELHSNKANKKAVLQQLEATLHLGKPKLRNVDDHIRELTIQRDELNQHSMRMNSNLKPANRTVFQILGELVRLQNEGVRAGRIPELPATKWSPEEYQERLRLINDVARNLLETGTPAESQWYGINADELLPTDIDRLVPRLASIVQRIEKLIPATERLASIFQKENRGTPADSLAIAKLAQQISIAPSMDRKSLAHAVWEENRDRIDGLLETGREFQAKRTEIDGLFADVAKDLDIAATRRTLASYGNSIFRFVLPAYYKAKATAITRKRRGCLDLNPARR